MPDKQPPTPQIAVPTPTLPAVVKPVLEWDTPKKARRSVRVMCDDAGLSVADKNLLCQVIHCESGFNINARNANKDGTVDWGIIQANTYWYIGKGKPLASIDEAINNPEKCIKIMITRFKQGGLTDWICYKSGMYKIHPA